MLGFAPLCTTPLASLPVAFVTDLVQRSRLATSGLSPTLTAVLRGPNLRSLGVTTQPGGSSRGGP